MSEEFQKITYPFTVPTDGYLHVKAFGNPAYLYVNSEKYNFPERYNHYFAIFAANNTVSVQFFPVKKGDTLSIAVQSGEVDSYFIPKS